MKICVFGLGEAGSHFARDLVKAGADVTAYDPAPVGTPHGVTRLPHPALAARKAEMILALTGEPDAKLAMLQAIEIIDRGALYADLSSSAPRVKSSMQQTASLRRFHFADVALMGRVQGHGIGTPCLVAGPGANRYVSVISSLGGSADIIDGSAGSAVGRELLRSVMLKGFAAVAAEAMRGADAVGELDLVWNTLVSEITEADEAWLRGLLDAGQDRHRQWADEMNSAHELLHSLGVTSTMSKAAATAFREWPAGELPTGAPLV